MHLAFDLRARHQRRHRVDDHQVYRARAHQRFGDLQRLLAHVGLRNQQALHVYAQPGGVGGVERVLHIDEGYRAAQLLRLSGDVQAQRGLARALRPKDLGDAPARDASHAQGDIQRERAGGDHLHRQIVGFAQAHDGAVAIALDDVAQRFIEHRAPGFAHGFTAVDRVVFSGVHDFFCHRVSPGRVWIK